jgi:hypothetical protein
MDQPWLTTESLREEDADTILSALQHLLEDERACASMTYVGSAFTRRMPPVRVRQYVNFLLADRDSGRLATRCIRRATHRRQRTTTTDG